MKKFISILIVILTILVCFILQSSVFAFIPIGGVTPNIMLIAAVCYGYLLGDKAGILTGLLCGLMYDMMFSPLIGLEGAILALIGYISGKCSRILYIEDLTFPVALTCGCDFIYGFLNFVILFLMRNRMIFKIYAARVILPEMIYTGLVSVFVIIIITHIYDRFIKERHANTLSDFHNGAAGRF